MDIFCCRARGREAPIQKQRITLAQRRFCGALALSDERAVVLAALRTVLSKTILPGLCETTLAENINGVVESPIHVSYEIASPEEPLRLQSCDLNPHNMDCLLVKHGQVNGNATGDEHMQLAFEIYDIAAVLNPLPFSYSTSLNSDSGKLNVTISGLRICVDATLDLSAEPSAWVDTIEVEMTTIAITAIDAGASRFYDLLLAAFQTRVRMAVESGIRQAVEAKLDAAQMTDIALKIADALRFTKEMKDVQQTACY